MTMKSRRIWLRMAAGSALVAPLAFLGQPAAAATNAASRSALKYQDGPKGDAKCATCLHFVPGKSPTDRGGCKIIPGDTEISPDGWCVGFAKKP